jgi:hypothetical protein
MLLLACLGLLVAGGGLPTALMCLGLLGAYYACTDGVLMATASALLPSGLRAGGLALLATAIGLARLVASVLFGAAWNWWGLESALALFLIGLGATMLMAAPTLSRVDRNPEHEATISR